MFGRDEINLNKKKTKTTEQNLYWINANILLYVKKKVLGSSLIENIKFEITNI